MVLNEIRSRLFYDRSSFDRPMTAVIADAVDRSSILGWFADANHALEVLTGHRAGLRPAIGAEPSRPFSFVDAAGTVGGPAIGQGVRAVRLASDIMSGHPTARTFNDWRKLTPGGGLPYLDPVFDRAISDGNFHRNAGFAASLDAQAKERTSP
jgi:hypothetical protein